MLYKSKSFRENVFSILELYGAAHDLKPYGSSWIPMVPHGSLGLLEVPSLSAGLQGTPWCAQEPPSAPRGSQGSLEFRGAPHGFPEAPQTPPGSPGAPWAPN